MLLILKLEPFLSAVTDHMDRERFFVLGSRCLGNVGLGYVGLGTLVLEALVWERVFGQRWLGN